MFIPRLLNNPIVFLMDTNNLVETTQMLETATAITRKVYVFAHYINKDIKNNLCAKYLTLIWKEAGETMIYDTLCADGKMTPKQVTFLLLPTLLEEKNVLVIHKQMTQKELEQIPFKLNKTQPQKSYQRDKEFSYLDLNLLRHNKHFEKN